MSAALSFNHNSTPRVRKNTLSYKVDTGLNALVLVIIVMVAFISLVYLAFSNRNATRGYALKTLENKRSELLITNEVWDMQIASVQSLASLQGDPKVRSMVDAGKPTFMRGDTAIAKK